MAGIIIFVLFVILLLITINAGKQKDRIDRSQRLDDFLYPYYKTRGRKAYWSRTSQRKNERDNHIAFQDLCCWIFWIVVIIVVFNVI